MASCDVGVVWRVGDGKEGVASGWVWPVADVVES